MKIRTLPSSSANFLPVKAHIKEHPAWFHRFDAVWTPTVLLLDAAGKERVRPEGYLAVSPQNRGGAMIQLSDGAIHAWEVDAEAIHTTNPNSFFTSRQTLKIG